VMRALPRRRSVMPCRRAERDSNIEGPMRKISAGAMAPANGCPF
jgi:hypothetical protein